MKLLGSFKVLSSGSSQVLEIEAKEVIFWENFSYLHIYGMATMEC